MKLSDSNISSEAVDRKFAFGFLLILFFLYGISSFFPDSFLWGVNHLAFFPDSIRVAVLFIALILASIVVYRGENCTAISKFRFLSFALKTRIVLLLLLGVTGFSIFYLFKIRTDMYGDTITLLSLLAEKKYTLIDLFDFSDKEPLTRMFHQFISYTSGLDQKLIFQIVSSLCGGIYLIVITIFIVTRTTSKSWKLLALVISFFTGANQLFFGHVEDYTLVYLALVLFFVLAWKFFEGKKVFGWMILVFIIGTRLHIETILLLPALIYASGVWIEQKHSRKINWLQTNRVILMLFGSMVFALLLYLFYFDAFRYVRGDQKEIMTKLFLPAVNPLPLPHNYSLISLNHFSDVLQHLLFVAAPSIVLVVFITVFYFKNIKWNDHRLIFTLISLFYFLVFNLTINPMLSLPRDWDMLSPIAVVILFTALTITHNFNDSAKKLSVISRLVGLTVFAAICSTMIFVINANEQLIALRLEGVGKWVFKSYYHGSSYIINMGQKLIKDPDSQIARRETSINDLIPYTKKPDLNISMLYYKLGVLCYQQKYFDKSEHYCSEATEYDSQNASALKIIGLSKIQQKRIDEAINLFSFYNKNINNPVIRDPDGIVLEKKSKFLRELLNSGADDVLVQNELDQLFLNFTIK